MGILGRFPTPWSVAAAVQSNGGSTFWSMTSPDSSPVTKRTHWLRNKPQKRWIESESVSQLTQRMVSNRGQVKRLALNSLVRVWSFGLFSAKETAFSSYSSKLVHNCYEYLINIHENTVQVGLCWDLPVNYHLMAQTSCKAEWSSHSSCHFLKW